MSPLDSGKSFNELADDEMAELEAIDWTPGQILKAISLALEDRNMPAVISLLHRLAVKDPESAQAIVTVIKARAS